MLDWDCDSSCRAEVGVVLGSILPSPKLGWVALSSPEYVARSQSVKGCMLRGSMQKVGCMPFAMAAAVVWQEKRSNVQLESDTTALGPVPGTWASSVLPTFRPGGQLTCLRFPGFVGARPWWKRVVSPPKLRLFRGEVADTIGERELRRVESTWAAARWRGSWYWGVLLMVAAGRREV